VISQIPQNSREFRSLVPESRRLISVGNLETLVASNVHGGIPLPRRFLQVDDERQVSERNVTRRMSLKHNEVMGACQV
jgi:hypothetical protein